MRDMEGPRMVSKEAKIPAMAISKRVGHFIDSGPSSTDFIVISRLTVVIPACWGWQNNSCPSALNHYPAILGGHIQWLWMGRTFHAHSNLFLTSEKILNHRKRPNKEIALNNEENQVCLVYTHKHHTVETVKLMVDCLQPSLRPLPSIVSLMGLYGYYTSAQFCFDDFRTQQQKFAADNLHRCLSHRSSTV